MRNFTDKTVIVTGSSRGIGKTTALAFLKAGANVVINARGKETLDATLKEFEDKGFHPLAVVADVSKVTDCQQLVNLTIEKIGKIDILINNAGLSMRGRFKNLSPEIFPIILNANLMTAVNSTHAALPEIKKTRGSIVFISSLMAIHGMPNSSPYCAAKSALNTFAESLRIELSRDKVHVGLMQVGIVTHYPGKKVLSADGSYIPVIRKGHQSEEDVARAVLRMVRRRTHMRTLTPAGKIFHFLHRFAPWLLNFMLKLTQDSELYK